MMASCRPLVARGRPIVNLPLEQDERITAILPVTEFPVKVFMATANGEENRPHRNRLR